MSGPFCRLGARAVSPCTQQAAPGDRWDGVDQRRAVPDDSPGADESCRAVPEVGRQSPEARRVLPQGREDRLISPEARRALPNERRAVDDADSRLMQLCAVFCKWCDIYILWRELFSIFKKESVRN